jgi:hypothetical protein
MSRPPYRALRIILRVFSVLAAVGGLFMSLIAQLGSSTANRLDHSEFLARMTA